VSEKIKATLPVYAATEPPAGKSGLQGSDCKAVSALIPMQKTSAGDGFGYLSGQHLKNAVLESVQCGPHARKPL
jgi:hypothetical protein